MKSSVHSNVTLTSYMYKLECNQLFFNRYLDTPVLKFGRFPIEVDSI